MTLILGFVSSIFLDLLDVDWIISSITSLKLFDTNVLYQTGLYFLWKSIWMDYVISMDLIECVIYTRDSLPSSVMRAPSLNTFKQS